MLGAFSFVYKQHVTRQTQERIIWDAAMGANTVNGYLAYMNEYPNGKHFAEAEAKMKALKEREAAAWENLKTSGKYNGISRFFATISRKSLIDRWSETV